MQHAHILLSAEPPRYGSLKISALSVNLSSASFQTAWVPLAMARNASCIGLAKLNAIRRLDMKKAQRSLAKPLNSVAVLSDQFEPVSVCPRMREAMRNKADATQRVRRYG
jgi:hypothetical protein